MTTATKATKATTTKATRAPKASPVVTTVTTPTKAKPAPSATGAVTKNAAAFVKLYKADTKNVAAKARLIGQSLTGGASNKDITEAFAAALEAADLIVPKSFSASVTHYATAYRCADFLAVASNDDALHALYQTSTGVVKAKVREEAVLVWADKNLSAEQIVVECRALIAEAKAPKSDPAPEVDPESEDSALDAADMEDDSDLDPVAVAAVMIANLRAHLSTVVQFAPSSADAVAALIEAAFGTVVDNVRESVEADAVSA